MNKKLKTAIALTACTTGAMYLINKVIFSLSVLDDHLGKTAGNYYEWRFGKVFYTKQGNGKPLLLVHNLNETSSSYEWSKLIKELSQTYTVYTIDLLGCGRSDKPNLTYTNYLYVQLISDFIKNIIGHKTDVVATAGSGAFVLMACHNDPELFQKLVVLNPENLQFLGQIPTKKTKSLKLLIEIPILGTFVYNMLVSKDMIRKTFSDKYFSNPCSIQDKDVMAYYESAHIGESGAKHLFSSLRGRYTNINIIHALKEINNSICLIGGGDVEEIDSTLNQYLYYNPAIETAIIKNTRLLPQLENPTAVFEQIQIFLA